MEKRRRRSAGSASQERRARSERGERPQLQPPPPAGPARSLAARPPRPARCRRPPSPGFGRPRPLARSLAAPRVPALRPRPPAPTAPPQPGRRRPDLQTADPASVLASTSSPPTRECGNAAAGRPDALQAARIRSVKTCHQQHPQTTLQGPPAAPPPPVRLSEGGGLAAAEARTSVPGEIWAGPCPERLWTDSAPAPRAALPKGGHAARPPQMPPKSTLAPAGKQSPTLGSPEPPTHQDSPQTSTPATNRAQGPKGGQRLRGETGALAKGDPASLAPLQTRSLEQLHLCPSAERDLGRSDTDSKIQDPETARDSDTHPRSSSPGALKALERSGNAARLCWTEPSQKQPEGDSPRAEVQGPWPPDLSGQRGPQCGPESGAQVAGPRARVAGAAQRGTLGPWLCPLQVPPRHWNPRLGTCPGPVEGRAWLGSWEAGARPDPAFRPRAPSPADLGSPRPDCASRSSQRRSRAPRPKLLPSAAARPCSARRRRVPGRGRRPGPASSARPDRPQPRPRVLSPGPASSARPDRPQPRPRVLSPGPASSARPDRPQPRPRVLSPSPASSARPDRPQPRPRVLSPARPSAAPARLCPRRLLSARPPPPPRNAPRRSQDRSGRAGRLRARGSAAGRPGPVPARAGVALTHRPARRPRPRAPPSAPGGGARANRGSGSPEGAAWPGRLQREAVGAAEEGEEKVKPAPGPQGSRPLRGSGDGGRRPCASAGPAGPRALAWHRSPELHLRPRGPLPEPTRRAETPDGSALHVG
ncbi:basic proline-rich protein-like [Suncus etruscus]|uniref:basic proline-rich protein-like n=1 Tax=Suncus etruscus TaxID=109475 RepID=UPI00210FA20E|nr:basic proline-rich protein-like [Suncus etruscus]